MDFLDAYSEAKKHKELESRRALLIPVLQEMKDSRLDKIKNCKSAFEHDMMTLIDQLKIVLKIMHDIQMFGLSGLSSQGFSDLMFDATNEEIEKIEEALGIEWTALRRFINK